ncbi:MAG: formate dehydrogenase subunit alpha [Acetobacteraceae bacterium]|nr:formate dehydrogenase subunit alpha [Acetobacteraceae bacterium]
MGSLKLQINGLQVLARPGATVFQAAEEAGIAIPHLCHHPLLSDIGACRLCLVEVKNARTLLASCVTPVQDGMVVETESPRVVRARRTVISLLLANHPEDCLTCQKAGECELQRYAYQYGVERTTYPGERKDYPPDDSNPFFIRDHRKCILCGRCIRMCAERQGRSAVDFAFRGFATRVTTAFDVPLEESPCLFCGNCAAVCPVGALMPRAFVGKGRAWEQTRVRTICPYCGVGCSLYLHVRDNRFIGASPAPGPANEGLLCVKGRFGLDFLSSPDRLTQPLLRKDGGLVPASWEEALEAAARGLKEARDRHGPQAVGVLSSAKCTNEENYLIQKLARAALGTNNVDHCARLCHASTLAGLMMAFGSAAMTNPIADIDRSQALLVIGSNAVEAHPVIGARIGRAHRRGAALLVADPRRVELALCADIHLQHRPGTDVALLNGLAHVLVEEGLYDAAFVEGRTEGFAELARVLEAYPPRRVEEITGVPAELLVRAARVYGTRRPGAIFFAMGITQHTTGTDNVLAIANLAMLAGNLGCDGGGVNPLRGQNNVQGACDAGALPAYLPGYQRVDDPEARGRFERAWGVRLPAEPGLTVVEMMEAARRGELKAMYIVGENPMLSDPDLGHVEEALKRLDFLAVQDIFLTETAKLADVVLPAASFAEREGTFTSTERRIQLLRRALQPPGRSRPDLEIVLELASRLGQGWQYRGPAAVMEEMAGLMPTYGGVSHGRLGEDGLVWPCPSPDHPGTPVLHRERFPRGRGRLIPVEYRRPAEVPDAQYPMVLTTGRILYHYHTGSMSRRSHGLSAHRPEARVEIHPEDAARLKVEDGDWVEVSTRRGRVRVRAEVTDRTARGVLFLPFHFAEAAANLLTNPALDPVARIPEFKVCAARVARAAQAEGGEGRAR